MAIVWVIPSRWSAIRRRVRFEDLFQQRRRERSRAWAMLLGFEPERGANDRRDLNTRTLQDAYGFLVGFCQANVEQHHESNNKDRSSLRQPRTIDGASVITRSRRCRRRPDVA
jgi:hypothetical protein